MLVLGPLRKCYIPGQDRATMILAGAHKVSIRMQLPKMKKKTIVPIGIPAWNLPNVFLFGFFMYTNTHTHILRQKHDEPDNQLHW